MKRQYTKKLAMLGTITLVVALSGCVRSMESIVAHRHEHLLTEVDQINAELEEAFGLARTTGISMSASVNGPRSQEP